MGEFRRHRADDEIQDALDGRLPAAGQMEFEGHLAGCEDCRSKRDAMAWAKAQAASLPGLVPPGDLAARIAGVLDEEDALTAAVAERRRARVFGGWPAWTAASLAAGLLLAFFIGRRADMPQAVAGHYGALRSGALSLDVATADVHVLEVHFAGAGLPFPVRVLDLGMMRYRLVGGRVHDLGGRPSVVVVYEGEDGHRLLCEMYRGSLTDLPPGDESLDHGGIPFRAFQRGDVTLAFWPEGDVLCVLAGEGGTKTILPLAFAKAMKAARAAGGPSPPRPLALRVTPADVFRRGTSG